MLQLLCLLKVTNVEKKARRNLHLPVLVYLVWASFLCRLSNRYGNRTLRENSVSQHAIACSNNKNIGSMRRMCSK